MTDFVTSDTHFGHKNLLNFCPESRPFADIDEMTEAIIDRHNSVVWPNDSTYFLGDFAFISNPKVVSSILSRLNGEKFFIFGNHDKVMRHPTVAAHFTWMRDYYEYKPKTEKKMAPIVMSHYPIYSWNRMHHGALHFYGHTHGQIPILHSGRARDIGCDTNNCYPFKINDLIEEMSKSPVVDARK